MLVLPHLPVTNQSRPSSGRDHEGVTHYSGHPFDRCQGSNNVGENETDESKRVDTGIPVQGVVEQVDLERSNIFPRRETCYEPMWTQQRYFIEGSS